MRLRPSAAPFRRSAADRVDCRSRPTSARSRHTPRWLRSATTSCGKALSGTRHWAPSIPTSAQRRWICWDSNIRWCSLRCARRCSELPTVHCATPLIARTTGRWRGSVPTTSVCMVSRCATSMNRIGRSRNSILRWNSDWGRCGFRRVRRAVCRRDTTVAIRSGRGSQSAAFRSCCTSAVVRCRSTMRGATTVARRRFECRSRKSSIRRI